MSEADGCAKRMTRLLLVLVGVGLLVAGSIILEDRLEIPVDVFYRAACATISLWMMIRIGQAYRPDTWPLLAVATAIAVNVAMFFTPIVQRPASRGEILLFAAPDVLIFLIFRTANFRVVDEQSRAVRQQLIVGTIIVATFCALLLSAAFIPNSRLKNLRLGQHALVAEGRQIEP